MLTNHVFLIGERELLALRSVPFLMVRKRGTYDVEEESFINKLCITCTMW